MPVFPNYGSNGTSDRPWLTAKRVLFLNHHGLGDAISATAALKSLRNALPSAHVVVTFISESIADLFNDRELFDEYLIYRSGLTNPHVTDKPRHVFGALPGVAGFLLQIRKLHCDLILGGDNINPNLLVALGKLAGIRWIIGECPKGSTASRFFNRYLEHRVPHLPHIEASLAILHAAGIPASVEKPFIPLTGGDRQFAQEWVLQRGLQRDKGFAIMHVGSGWKRDHKRWPTERYAELGRWFVQVLGMEIVFVGTQDERGIVEESIQAARVDAINLAGSLTLRQLAAIVERARVVVGNDSGVVHLGGALGIPTVAMYGPTDANRAKPYGVRVRTIWNRPPCSPCDSVLPFGCGLPICIRDVQVSHVQQAVMDVIGQ